MIKEDIIEKGAICQRDQETYGVAPHIPGGFIQAEHFRRLMNYLDGPSEQSTGKILTYYRGMATRPQTRNLRLGVILEKEA